MAKFTKNIKISLIKLLFDLFNAFGFKKNSYHTKPNRFLIISTTGIGDTLWGTPAIRALKESFPESYIGMLTNPLGFDLLKRNPYIDKLFIFRRGIPGLFSIPALLKNLRQNKFQVAFIFHASDRIVWLICSLTGASRIIGIAGQNKGLDFVLTNAIKQDNIHGIEMRLKLVREVGVETSTKTISFYLTDQDKKKASKFLEDKGINKNSLLIGLHPGAQKPFKCWPAKNFIETGNILAKVPGCKIIITGDSNEKALANEIASKIKGSISIAGMFSLRETAAIIERMSLFITNDTGPMHIASALGIPIVAFFCPTDPNLCGPYYAENVVVIQKPITCNPCIGKKCHNPTCMEQITPQEVISATESLLLNVKITSCR